jgi:hypothetical protein
MKTSLRTHTISVFLGEKLKLRTAQRLWSRDHTERSWCSGQLMVHKKDPYKVSAVSRFPDGRVNDGDD